MSYVILYVWCLALLCLGLYLYSTTPYTEYMVVAVNQTMLSEEIFTISVYDSKFIPKTNETQIRYIKDYALLGSPNFQIISLNTTKIIYPNDNLQLKKLVITTDCEYYTMNNQTQILLDKPLPIIHAFNLKSNFHGDCGKTVFYKLLDKQKVNSKN